MTQRVYCQDYFLTQRKIISSCIWNPSTMNREPGNRNKTANAPTFAVELSSQLKCNEKTPEIWTLRRRSHNTAKKFHAFLIVKVDNLVIRKAKFSLILPPHQKNLNETQSKKWAKNIEVKSLRTCSRCNHDGLCRLRTCSFCSSRVEQDSPAAPPGITWWLAQGHPGTEPSSDSKEWLWLDLCPWAVPWMNNRVQLTAVKKIHGFHQP